MMKTWLNRWALLIGMVLLLPMTAPALTTTPIFVIPPVQQVVFTYDADFVRVIFDKMLTGSEAAVTPVPFIDSAADFLAAKSSTALSPYRVTAPGETFIRYESGNPAFTKITSTGGVKPGTFAAPASEGVVPVAERVPTYNLPSPEIPRPNAMTLTPPPGTPIIGPRPVAGGTGNEVNFWMGY